MDKFICTGTGTCGASGPYGGPAASGSFTPYSVSLPSGNYLVVPNYSTGGISAVVQTSRGK